MERERDHRLDLGKIDAYHRIVIGDVAGLQLPIFIFSAVNGKITVCFLVGYPN